MKPRNVLVLLVIAVLCAVAWFVVDRTSAPAEKKLPAVWPKLSRADVTSVTVKGQGSTLELRRRGAAADQWNTLVGTELVRANANDVDDLLGALERQAVRDRIDYASIPNGNVAQYGLDKPDVTIELKGPAEPVLIRFGHISREGGSVYADGGEKTDVWLVARDAMDHAIAGISGGMRDKRLFDSSLYDVATLEIVKDGVTRLQATRDLSQIWRFAQPFKGYANNTQFEQELAQIVNVEVAKWEEFGAPDLVKYGLDKPQYEVRITPKGEGRTAEVLLVGKENENGVYAMSAGTKAVAFVGRRFFEAVSMDPMKLRDLSFTRLGNDGSAIDVRLKGVAYKLERAGATWEVTVGSTHRPADGDKVKALLDAIRSWQTVEFRDRDKPEDFGVDGTELVEITLTAIGRDAPGKLVLLFGNEGPPRANEMRTVYAMRKDDGQLELADAGPLETLRKGAEQFFRGSVLELSIDSVAGFDREPGSGPEGTKVERASLSRDLDASDKSWKLNGGVGKPDPDAINEILAALRSVTTQAWLPFDAEKDTERTGLTRARPETMIVTAHLKNVAGTDPDPTLIIGKRAPDGGYYGRVVVAEGPGGGWMFVLSDEFVAALSKPLEKAPPPKDQPKKDD
jgi:uncharacterized protein DUF4340